MNKNVKATASYDRAGFLVTKKLCDELRRIYGVIAPPSLRGEPPCFDKPAKPKKPKNKLWSEI